MTRALKKHPLEHDVVGVGKTVCRVSTPPLGAADTEICTLFDGLAVELGLKKIKTLGNSYMAASGVPVTSLDHAARAAHSSLDMPDRFNERTAWSLQVRIGIDSGAVVAGVIGRRLFLCDLWGDAVNTASRMESHGVAGRVQVSESTRRRLGDALLLDERGVLDVEGAGELKTWFLTGRNRVSTSSEKFSEGGWRA